MNVSLSGEVLALFVTVISASGGALVFIWRSAQAWTRIEMKLGHSLEDSTKEHERIEVAIKNASDGRRALNRRVDNVEGHVAKLDSDLRVLVTKTEAPS